MAATCLTLIAPIRYRCVGLQLWDQGPEEKTSEKLIEGKTDKISKAKSTTVLESVFLFITRVTTARQTETSSLRLGKLDTPLTSETGEEEYVHTFL